MSINKVKRGVFRINTFVKLDIVRKVNLFELLSGLFFNEVRFKIEKVR